MANKVKNINKPIEIAGNYRPGISEQMELYNVEAAHQVLGALMWDLNLIFHDNVKPEYFEEGYDREIFNILHQAARNNMVSIRPMEFFKFIEDNKLKSNPRSDFNNLVVTCYNLPYLGSDPLAEKEIKAYQINVDNYKYYLDTLRKYHILKYFINIGIDIKHYFISDIRLEQEDGSGLEGSDSSTRLTLTDKIKAAENFNHATPREIVEYYVGNISIDTYRDSGDISFEINQSKKAGDDGTIAQFNNWSKEAKSGPAYASGYLNKIFNWIEPGKLTIGSAGTNTGKTRMTISNMCYAFAPVYWDAKYEEIEYDFPDFPSLYELNVWESYQINQKRQEQEGGRMFPEGNEFTVTLDIAGRIRKKGKRYKGSWMANTNGIHNKCLYIGTEMDLEREIEPMIQAYMANIPENKIKSGTRLGQEEYEEKVLAYKRKLYNKLFNGGYTSSSCFNGGTLTEEEFCEKYIMTEEEENRYFSNELTPKDCLKLQVVISALISNENIYLEHMPNYDVSTLRTVIKKYSRNNNVHHVFFDYIHTTTKLIEEFTRNSGARMDVREDQVLSNLGVELKSICEELNVSIDTWTQVSVSRENDANASGADLIRGAKSLADKADHCFILRNMSAIDYSAAMKSLDMCGYNTTTKREANVYIEVYKNRSTEFNKIRILLDFDRGTMRLHDKIVTDVSSKFPLLANGVSPLYSRATVPGGFSIKSLASLKSSTGSDNYKTVSEREGESRRTNQEENNKGYSAMLKIARAANIEAEDDEPRTDKELKAKYSKYNKLPIPSDYDINTEYGRYLYKAFCDKNGKAPPKFIKDRFDNNIVKENNTFTFFRDNGWANDPQELDRVYEEAKTNLLKHISELKEFADSYKNVVAESEVEIDEEVFDDIDDADALQHSVNWYEEYTPATKEEENKEEEETDNSEDSHEDVIISKENDSDSSAKLTEEDLEDLFEF